LKSSSDEDFDIGGQKKKYGVRKYSNKANFRIS